MALRALLLDLGNVLAFHDNALLFRRLGEPAGLTGPEVEARLAGPTWDDANRGTVRDEEIRRSICGALGIDLPMHEFAPLWSSHFTDNATIFPVLERLASGLELVLVSNTNTLHFSFLRERLSILQRFHALIASCEIGHIKPEREIYARALQAAGCDAEEALFFDDVESYVIAAREFGLPAEVFTTTERFVETLRERGIDL